MVLAFALTLSRVSPARGSLSVEPLREVLRRSGSALRSCQRTFSLPDGRYLVRFEIDVLGKLANYRLEESPARLSGAAGSCVEAAFSRLRFPARSTPAALRAPQRPRPPGHPPLPRTRRRGDAVRIAWPFVLRSAPTR